jgi:hypothetical protein
LPFKCDLQRYTTDASIQWPMPEESPKFWDRPLGGAVHDTLTHILKAPAFNHRTYQIDFFTLRFHMQLAPLHLAPTPPACDDECEVGLCTLNQVDP